MSIHLPEPVSSPGRVYVAHAAGRTRADLLDEGLECLRDLGFQVARDPTVGRFGESAPLLRGLSDAASSYLAAPDVLRARDLTHALTTPDVDAVITARGGYGAMRVVERLPWGLLAARPRWIVGYSDITTLHLWAYAQGVASIHGPMVAGLSKHGNDGSIPALSAALAGRPAPLPGISAAWPGRFEGRLVGGNLSLLAALRPTRHWPKLDGLILFIEEVGEPLYRIDRALQTLKMAGGLERVAGFAIGQLTGCGEPSDPEDAPAAEQRALELVLDRLSSYRLPVVVGLPVGHGTPNAAFIHGARYAWSDDVLACVETHSVSSAAPPVPQLDRVGAPLARAVAAGICSGVQVHVSQGAEVTHDLAMGVTALTDDAASAMVTPQTLFDTASVTKAISTAVLAHLAVSRGVVAFDDRCPRAISISEPTLRDLLRHTSGLPAYERVWKMARKARDPRAFAERRFAEIAADPDRFGTEIYSDVGYVALGRWLEALLGETLATLFDRHIGAPLSLGASAAYGIATDDLASVAATEICAYRGATLQGIVHDENCQVLGGSCGHAGVFATAAALGAIARSLLGIGPSILPPDAVETMWSTGERVGTYTLGWDTPSGPSSNAGSLMDPGATVGHLGFTGTSLWIDRSRQVVVVLLSNRVHPKREHAGIRWLRPTVQDAAMRELGYT